MTVTNVKKERRMSDDRDRVLDYLAHHNVMTLATNGPSGPWAAAVFYANDGLTLTFLSSPTTRHATDLAADPRCAAAIHEDYQEWSDIKGVQMEGRARILTGADRDTAIERYARKFSIVDPATAPEPIRTAMADVAWFEFVTVRCFFVDNSRGFGHRDEIEMP